MMTHPALDNSLRKVAILVASLDEASAEQLLASLPPQQARAVRLQVDDLTEIHPDEQRAVVAEFRRSFAQSSESLSTGVELEASLLERIDHQDYGMASVSKAYSPFEALSSDDVDALATMLKSESPQTVAVILSRLDADRAAEVLNRFSIGEQHAILDRLAELDSTDEQAIRVVEAQVSQWISTQRQRRERMAAGKQMVERLMSRQPARTEAAVIAGRMPRAASPLASEYAQLSTRRSALPQPVRYEPLPVAAPQRPTVPTNPFAGLSTEECMKKLEALSDQTLLAALSRCESRVALLSLVGVSEKLLRRVTRGLSRPENKLFQQQLRDIGPTRLSDILTAQQEVLHVATQLT
jgi:flagellar motor switch protein FliG